ncbi:unnamed protein product [Sphagnum balticum]
MLKYVLHLRAHTHVPPMQAVRAFTSKPEYAHYTDDIVFATESSNTIRSQNDSQTGRIIGTRMLVRARNVGNATLMARTLRGIFQRAGVGDGFVHCAQFDAVDAHDALTVDALQTLVLTVVVVAVVACAFAPPFMTAGDECMVVRAGTHTRAHVLQCVVDNMRRDRPRWPCGMSS